MHRWGAIICALPLVVVIGTGLLLQLKKQSDWVQPPTKRGTADAPQISFAEILEAASDCPQAGIAGWQDIDRMDVRPGHGIVKVRGKNRWEVQLDTRTAEVLSVAYRRSDLIESLHDGSWFHANVKLWVFLPSGLVLFMLWISGLYLWFLPIVTRRNNRARRALRASQSTGESFH
jgi:uncharacterized iron-regulated membrane protein